MTRPIDPPPQENTLALGRAIRDRRKALRISMAAAAEAAGVSRVTWHRIEKGEPTVAFASWLKAAEVLGRQIGILEDGAPPCDLPDVLPLRIRLADYPQLERLGWQLRGGVGHMAPREAFGLYERNWRHVDEGALDPREAALIEGLRQVFGERQPDV